MIRKKEPMSMRKGDMLFNVIHIMTARFIFTFRKNADCRTGRVSSILMSCTISVSLCLFSIE